LTANDLTALEKASATIEKRGPDARGKAVFDQLALAHRRLSILDTDPRANQPMQLGDFSLVYNGEIYNYKELRDRLAAKYAVAFRTTGDTEVLLHGLIREGTAFIQRLNGFFAFAFYNRSDHRLILARDRFGIKPLYYFRDAQRLIFGSSLGTIIPFLNDPVIDRESLSLYLGLSYIPAPKTILEKVEKLEPGTMLTIDSGAAQVSRYYEIEERERIEISKSVALGKLRKLLTESVEKRMVADVSLGTFLSGGVDSSIITYLAAQFNPKIPSFSIGFPDHSYFDESKRAASIASHLGVEHHIVQVGEDDLDEHLDDILFAMDEPFADSSGVLVNLLSEFAAKHVKVALSGDGADELLGGYNKHRGLLRSLRSDWKNRTLKRASPALEILPSSRNKKSFDRMRKIKRYSQGLKLSFEERYLRWACFTPESRVSALLKSPYPFGESEVLGHYLRGLNEAEFNTVLKADFGLVLANDMLCKVDGMSMHRSLEVRVPFLDHEFVDFIFGLPSEYKLNPKSGKLLLKEAFADAFPEGFFNGAKRGFEAPLTHWFKGRLRSRIEKYFDRTFIEEQGLFEHQAIQRVIRKALGPSPGDTPHTLWALLVFQNWYWRHFLNSSAR
jgi:asparagine synthase (glutamine-hydrolysing)